MIIGECFSQLQFCPENPFIEVILASCDHATFEALEHSGLSIGVCMLEFSEKRGRRTAEEEDGADANK